MSEHGLTSGRVKWFNKDKGFGFISLPDGHMDVFVHANQLRKSGIEEALLEGETVRFVIEKGVKGTYATHISKVQEKSVKDAASTGPE